MVDKNKVSEFPKKSWIQYEYESDKAFYNILGITSAFMLSAFLYVTEVYDIKPISEVQAGVSHFVSLTVKEPEVRSFESKSVEGDSEQALDEGLQMVAESSPSSIEHSKPLKSVGLDEFNEVFEDLFEEERERLIQKYKQYFSVENVSMDVYEEFILEFSRA